MNNMQESEDVSHGFVRRLHFIDFPIMFTSPGEPDDGKPNTLRKNPTIERELLNELPGICNWALAGLKRLREIGHIPDTPDHRRNLREFLLVSNPVLDWITHSGVPTGWMARSDAYKAYHRWCAENGRKPLSSHKLYSRMRQMEGFNERKYCGTFEVWIPGADEEPLACVG